jgi:hypothetical protein
LSKSEQTNPVIAESVFAPLNLWPYLLGILGAGGPLPLYYFRLPESTTRNAAACVDSSILLVGHMLKAHVDQSALKYWDVDKRLIIAPTIRSGLADPRGDSSRNRNREARTFSGPFRGRAKPGTRRHQPRSHNRSPPSCARVECSCIPPCNDYGNSRTSLLRPLKSQQFSSGYWPAASTHIFNFGSEAAQETFNLSVIITAAIRHRGGLALFSPTCVCI